MRTLVILGSALLLLFASVLPPRVASGSSLVGDFNDDCSVNALDLSLIAHRYLTGVGSLLYAPQYDLNHDGFINVLDVQIAAAHYLEHC